MINFIAYYIGLFCGIFLGLFLFFKLVVNAFELIIDFFDNKK